MSFAGTPAHLHLVQLLQQLESHRKTGLLTVVHGQQTVSVYFRQGQLLWIEPQQGHEPLETGLSHAGAMPQRDFADASGEMSRTSLGNPGRAYRSEVPMVQEHPESGLLSHDPRYTGGTREASEILRELLTWSEAEVSFAEGAQAPADRFPLPLRIASVFTSSADSHSASSVSLSNREQFIEEPTRPLPAPSLFKIPGQMRETASLQNTPPTMPATLLPARFKRQKPPLLETPPQEVPPIPPLPTIEEHIRPAIRFPQVFKSSAGLLGPVRVMLPLPDYDITAKLSPPKQRRKAFLRWEVLLILAVLLVAALAHGFNMFHFPYYEDDEGTYMSQAWAVVHLGRLAYYTYWYDHAPAGWLLIATWTVITGGIHTFGPAMNSGRVLMLLLQLGSTFMLYCIACRISHSVTVAVIASLLFALSPYGLYFHRRVLLDNITTFWMLLSILLLVLPHLSLRRIWLSALALGISVLSKEVTIFLIPILAYLVFYRADKSHRWFAAVGWITLVGSIISLYVLMAILKGELFPSGTLFGGIAPHVSLLGTLQSQASRGKDGGFLDFHSYFWYLTKIWAQDDPMLVIAGSFCAIVSVLVMKKQRLVGVMGAATLSLWAFLGRGGEVIVFYLVPLLPLLALNIGLIIGLAINRFKTAQVSSTGITIARTINMVAVGLCLIGILTGYRVDALGFKSNSFLLWNSTQADAQNQATQWIEKHLPLSSHMIIDESMWTDLYDNGYTFVHYYWKVQDDPAIRDKVFHNDWRTVDYVVTTLQLLGDAQRNHMTLVEEAVMHSTVIASFDTGGWTVEIRRVNK